MAISLGGAHQHAGINVTPLIDVLLVLARRPGRPAGA